MYVNELDDTADLIVTILEAENNDEIDLSNITVGTTQNYGYITNPYGLGYEGRYRIDTDSPTTIRNDVENFLDELREVVDQAVFDLDDDEASALVEFLDDQGLNYLKFNGDQIKPYLEIGDDIEVDEGRIYLNNTATLYRLENIDKKIVQEFEVVHSGTIIDLIQDLVRYFGLSIISENLATQLPTITNKMWFSLCLKVMNHKKYRELSTYRRHVSQIRKKVDQVKKDYVTIMDLEGYL